MAVANKLPTVHYLPTRHFSPNFVQVRLEYEVLSIHDVCAQCSDPGDQEDRSFAEDLVANAQQSSQWRQRCWARSRLGKW